MCVVYVQRIIAKGFNYMNVFIFAKHIWNRDRAIYDQAPKTVQKYFDLHT